MPTVIVAVNYARVPKKRLKLCAKNIRERDGNRCQYTGVLLRPDEGSLDHVVPRSRGGPDTWENLVWASKQVNTRKAQPPAARSWLEAAQLQAPAPRRNCRCGAHPQRPTASRNGNCS